MMSLPSNLKQLFAKTKLVILPEDYFVIHLPVDTKAVLGEWYRPDTTRFAVFIREPRGITLIVPRRKWLRMKSMFPKYEKSGPMKVVGFDAKLSLEAHGYRTSIGMILSEAKLTAVPISSFNFDHILVAKTDLPATIKVLRGFLDSCKK